MTASSPKSLPSIGFLTVVDAAEQGLFGGYLVLTLAGRPLEFYCTAPVRPNRAQEILYGATLEPFLYGEQIGQTLVKKSKLNPVALCTDQQATLAVREHIQVPVMLIDHTDSQTGPEQVRIDRPHAPSAPKLQSCFRLASIEVTVRSDYAHDQAQIEQAWSENPHDLDLTEPFERIREAIDEARRAGKRA